MTGSTTKTEDEIFSCTIDFEVHSATEVNETINEIAAIDGIEEVKTVKTEA